MSGTLEIRERIARFDWERVTSELDERGYARLPGLLKSAECRAIDELYDDRKRFRSHIDMALHRFGEGEYRYFDRPLPPLVEQLRRHLYPPLARVANQWNRRLGRDDRLPTSHSRFLKRCKAHDQLRPTPLLLRYRTGGFNCLHQDLYGDVAFPLQVACLLDRPDEDFTGGEFLLMEQRPRMQARAEAIRLSRGEGIVFPTRERPVRGTRGFYRAQLRHGVSRIHSGRRTTLGIIFHDAR